MITSHEDYDYISGGMNGDQAAALLQFSSRMWLSCWVLCCQQGRGLWGLLVYITYRHVLYCFSFLAFSGIRAALSLQVCHHLLQQLLALQEQHLTLKLFICDVQGLEWEPDVNSSA